MTRRIAITILLSVWAAIFVAGSGVWGVAYVALLRELDRNALNQVRQVVASRYASRRTPRDAGTETSGPIRPIRR